MNKNPILDEIRSVRESLLASAGGTLDALVDRLQAEERRSQRPLWTPVGDDARAATATQAPARDDSGKEGTGTAG
jgi:hypothetical protein